VLAFVFVGHTIKKIFLSLLVSLKLGSNQVKLFSEDSANIYLIMELVFVAVD
jgi:hypothetical protein